MQQFGLQHRKDELLALQVIASGACERIRSAQRHIDQTKILLQRLGSERETRHGMRDVRCEGDYPDRRGSPRPQRVAETIH